ncbi:hypothetical protein L2V44_14025 [Staphylococcus aureus]|nr:hypothetical protein [Staphylococcus aureus]
MEIFWNYVRDQRFNQIQGFAPNEVECQLGQPEVEAITQWYEIPRALFNVTAPEEGERIYDAKGNLLGVYEECLAAGIRFPLCRFYRELFHMYNITLAQLIPNSCRLIVGFLLRCREVDVPSTVRLWSYFYVFKIGSGDMKGWIYFSRRLNVPSIFADSGPPAVHGWKPRYFFLATTSQLGIPKAWNKPNAEMLPKPALSVEEERYVVRLRSWSDGTPRLMSYLSPARIAWSLATRSGQFVMSDTEVARSGKCAQYL